MRIGAWHFNPGLWPSLALVALLPLLTKLGFWQLDRAEEKQALYTEYQDRISAEPVDLGQPTHLRGQPEEMYWRRCLLRGTYDPEVVYLLDNQVVRGQVGYQVFTRFLLEDGASVLVNRGWTAAPERRTAVPEIITAGGAMTLTGMAKPPPVTGLALGRGKAEELADDLVRVQRIDIARITADNHWSLLPYIVRLDPPAPTGMSRVLPEPGSGKEKHLGYAFQWFALAATLLVIYVVVNTKKQRNKPGEDGKSGIEVPPCQGERENNP